MTTELDHIAVVAPNLATGAAWVREVLGVDMPAGGKHPEMGTHNRLVGLGGDVYLEVIAVDPEAQRPAHARWFGLDHREKVEHDWREGRRLRAYVARCTDIASAIGDSETFGAPVRVSRSDRDWLFAVRPDGELPMGGALPFLIDWGARGSPAASMPDLGLRLVGLQIQTPAVGGVYDALNVIGMTLKLVDIRPGFEVRLTAAIRTPRGVRVLN